MNAQEMAVLTAADSVMDGSNNSTSLAASSMHRKHTVITKVSAIKDTLIVLPDGGRKWSLHRKTSNRLSAIFNVQTVQTTDTRRTKDLLIYTFLRKNIMYALCSNRTRGRRLDLSCAEQPKDKYTLYKTMHTTRSHGELAKKILMDLQTS